MERIWSLKIVLLGEPQAGKSSFMMKLVEDQAINHQSASIRPTQDGNFLMTMLTYDSGSTGLQVTLVEEARPLEPRDRKSFFKNAIGAIIVYDVTKSESRRVLKWIREYLKYSYIIRTPLLIVGNKMDLIDKHEEDRIFETHRKLLTTIEHNFPNITPIFSKFTSLEIEDDIIEIFDEFLHHLMHTLEQKYKSGDTTKTDIQTYNHLIPAVYLIGFHEMHGSIILSRIREDGQTEITAKEMESGVKLSSVLDFENIEKLDYISTSFPWSDPLGYCNYIAFTVSNPNARGGLSLYIITLVWDTEIKEYILEWSHIIEGYLQVSMDEFKMFLEATEVDFTTKDGHQNKRYDEDIRFIISDLRDHVIALITQSMLKDEYS